MVKITSYKHNYAQVSFTLSVWKMHIILMQTGWIYQAGCRDTRQLASDPTCLPLKIPFSIKTKKQADFQGFE